MGETMEMMTSDHNIDFSGPTTGCLVDSIDFDDLFVGIHFDVEEVLPELEIDPEFLADLNALWPETANQECAYSNEDCSSKISGGCVSDVGMSKKAGNYQCSVWVMEVEKDQDKMEKSKSNSPAMERDQKTKISPSSQAKNNNNNRKTKVDWTPELHKRFVEAVEKLGVEKAVPSRILELMATPCLTRHNIASHLQKYRSHRKHFIAREAAAEAASWSQKRGHMYGGAIAVTRPAGGGGKGKVIINHPNWHPPTIGLPQPSMSTPPPFRPLHVWGHPTSRHLQHQPTMPVWPKQLVPPPSLLFHPPPPPPPVDPSFWHPRHQYSFATPLVQGNPPPQPTVCKPEHGAQSDSHHPPLDSHPTTESIDKAIGEVLTKPGIPLPIGLKPPSMESVMCELHRQGIPDIPPS